MPKAKAVSDLGRWVLDRYGGSDPVSTIKFLAEDLVKSVGITKPPVRLSQIAQYIGLNPLPIYQSPSEQGEEGRLVLENDALRIYLRTADGAPPRSGSRDFLRQRFTYAHELAHALLYDLDQHPQKRAAPRSSGREEEKLCNYAAGQFMVPPFLLEAHFRNLQEVSLEELRRVANLFQVSQFSFLIHAEPLLAKLIPENRIYMASVECFGIRRTGRKEPRCIVCYVPESLKAKGLTFLHTYQRVARVMNVNSGDPTPWSLASFFDSPDEGTGVHHERLKTPGGKVLVAESVHTRLSRSSYVWTEAKIDFIE